MAGTLDFTRQFALAARAIAGLTPWLDLAALIDIAREHVQIFVVEASSFRAIGGFPSTAPPASSSMRAATTSTSPALLVAPGFSLCLSFFGVFAHELHTPIIACAETEFCAGRAMRSSA